MGRQAGTFETADFAAYKAKYGKSFGAEENMRHENYLRTVAKINNHNAEYDQGKHTWFMGENEFMDWTQEELDNRNGFKSFNVEFTGVYVPRGHSADSVDWRDQGAVNAVKDQGQCGSCWAFSTVASLEGQEAIVNGKLPDCSEQQLVDCDPGSSGCNGGLMTAAFTYIKGQGKHGIDTQTSYPYTARDGTCDKSKTGDENDVSLSSMDTLSSPEVMSLLFRMPLPTLDQSPLLPMLPHGPATLVESSMVPAAMLLTTVLPW